MQIHMDAPNLGDIDKRYLNACLDSSYVSTFGPYVTEFEKKIKFFLGSGPSVAVQSGTAGLHMALHELGIGEGDEVILPVLTFIATANAVSYVGAKPVFVDIDNATWNMDPALVEKAITSRTKAIIPVHLYGNPCAMDELSDIAGRYGLSIIEDATESLGSTFDGRHTGTFGDFGVFSFNGNKLITTGGGGMVCGRDQEQIQHIRFLVNQARTEKSGYYHSEIGFNYRLTNLEASLGLAQMEKLQLFIEKKKRFHAIYREHIDQIEGVRFQEAYDESDAVWWLTSIYIATDAIGLTIPDIMRNLKDRGIPTRRIFMPLTEFAPYACRGQDQFSNAYEIYQSGLSLPSSTLNTFDATETVAATLKIILEDGHPKHRSQDRISQSFNLNWKEH